MVVGGNQEMKEWHWDRILKMMSDFDWERWGKGKGKKNIERPFSELIALSPDYAYSSYFQEKQQGDSKSIFRYLVFEAH